MKTSIKNRKKNFLALCLSVMMVTSVAALASCKDSSSTDSSSSSSSSSSAAATVKDDSLVKNGGFETFNNKEGLNPIVTSVTGWSRAVNSATSGSALSSKAASGIIDTEASAWTDLTKNSLASDDAAKALTEAQAKAQWNSLSTRDKLAYYEAWEKANKDDDIDEELDFYQSFNIDHGDIPTCVNPGTHYKEGEEGYGEDTKVLMIHNEYPERDSTSTYKSLGTAQKYTSSSTVTVQAGSSAEFSVWVKTTDLKCSATDGSVQPAVGKGAYISVTHSVGGASLDAYQVKNINTETMDPSTLSNGWMKYSFYLKGSSYSDTTFTIVLGLGQGGGTDRLEYVNGYAFFDDIQCNVISNESYTEKTQAAGITQAAGFEDKKDKKTIDASKASTSSFAMDFYGDFNTSPILESPLTVKATTSKVGGVEYSSKAGANPAPWLGGGFDGTNDKTKVYNTVAEMQAEGATNKYLNAVYTDHFANLNENKFVGNDKVLLLLSANGVAYTADSNYKFEFKDANGDSVDHLAISFFVKTSEMNGFTGAGITLNDGNNKTSFTSIDTSALETVNIGDDKDVYDGWQKLFFFVSNDTEKADATFTLSFNFGPTAITDTTETSYLSGFAAFTGFKVYPMSKQEYESAQSGTTAKTVSLVGNTEKEASGNSGFDTAAIVPSNALESGLANLKNYNGVYSDSAYVNASGEGDAKVNLYKNAGLLNQEHFAEYYKTTDAPAWMQGLTNVATNKSSATTVWNSVFGKDTTQPLFIWNDGVAEKAYGFIGKSTAIEANSYAAISVRVKVGGATPEETALAKASVYLVDMDDDTHQKTLSIGRTLTYWYDNDGNICVEDPTSSDFNKRTDIAFKLQSNGLYLANKNWSGYSKLAAADQTAYFANLENYATDANGNKIVAEGGASHNYNDKWDNEGVDGIAFYYNATTQTYYADKAKTVPVKNLASITSADGAEANKPLIARYDAQAEKDLKITVSNTNGAWTTVTFYIHTGDVAKNYRVEVWSGERNGAANPANTYVAFDTNNPGDAESNFTSLIEEYKDEESAVYFEGVFSYFDSDSYLRYNSALDENKVGNVYEKSFVPSDNLSGVAYLSYTESNRYTTFADYSLSEKTVAATIEDDDAADKEETEENGDETNAWLLASSISIAAVLVLAVASLIIRKVVARVRRKRGYKVKTTSANKVKSSKKEK